MESEKADCEILKQFKIFEDNILMKRPNEDWVIVTPLVALEEFSPVEVPKADQSIIFQVNYCVHYIPVMVIAQSWTMSTFFQNFSRSP